MGSFQKPPDLVALPGFRGPNQPERCGAVEFQVSSCGRRLAPGRLGLNPTFKS